MRLALAGLQTGQGSRGIRIHVDVFQAGPIVFDGNDEFVGARFDVGFGTGALAFQFAADEDLVGFGFVVDMTRSILMALI